MSINDMNYKKFTWMVETEKDVFSETNEDNYNIINKEEIINQIISYENRFIIYNLEKDILQVLNEGTKFEFEFVYVCEGKKYILNKENLVLHKPILYKRAHTDFNTETETQEKEFIEGYFNGFENSYDINGKILKISFVLGLENIQNIITKEIYVMINKGLLEISSLTDDDGLEISVISNNRRELLNTLFLDTKTNSFILNYSGGVL